MNKINVEKILKQIYIKRIIEIIVYEWILYKLNYWYVYITFIIIMPLISTWPTSLWLNTHWPINHKWQIHLRHIPDMHYCNYNMIMQLWLEENSVFYQKRCIEHHGSQLPEINYLQIAFDENCLNLYRIMLNKTLVEECIRVLHVFSEK